MGGLAGWLSGRDGGRLQASFSKVYIKVVGHFGVVITGDLEGWVNVLNSSTRCCQNSCTNR